MQATKMTGAGETVSIDEAARLMNVTDRWVRKMAESGKLEASQTVSVLGGGQGGTVYRVYVDSLPFEAQILYWQGSAVAEVGAGCREFDLAGYKARKGEKGMEELLRRQRAALAAHGLRMRYEDVGLKGYKQALATLAGNLGIPTMTLYRWERGYAEMGLKGIARPIRADKGQSRSMCLLARDYVEHLMYDQRKPPQTLVHEKVTELAERLGADACENCPYRQTSRARSEIIEERGEDLPLCDQAGKGMQAPSNYYAVNRAVEQIDKSTLCYARYGSRYWDAKYLQKVVRAKPELPNEVWFGDHHKLDLFVLDRDGRAVRPWLTAWMDACTSAIVGWVLTLEPNSDTVAESFARAAVATKGSEFWGLPIAVYIDNGKDYRSTRFEGGEYVDRDIGRLNEDFCQKSMLEALRVEVHHAIPYWAWTKPIERMFGTLEKRWMKNFPAWCGDSPGERPQDLQGDIRDGRIMTFEVFAEKFKADVIDAYHNFQGSDDKMTPMERYLAKTRARTDDPDWATMCLLKSQSVKRVVRTQGVVLDKVIYQDVALSTLVGQSVTVLYNRGENMSVSILYKGQFICEAERADVFGMIERDREKLENTMAEKAKQRRAVTGRIAAIEQSVRGIHREAYAEEVDERRDKSISRVSNMEAIKRQRAKTDVEKKRKRRAGDLDAGERLVQDSFRERGARMLRGESVQ